LEGDESSKDKIRKSFEVQSLGRKKKKKGEERREKEYSRKETGRKNTRLARELGRGAGLRRGKEVASAMRKRTKEVVVRKSGGRGCTPRGTGFVRKVQSKGKRGKGRPRIWRTIIPR